MTDTERQTLRIDLAMIKIAVKEGSGQWEKCIYEGLKTHSPNQEPVSLEPRC